jgi:hypothetical protein
MSLSDYLVDSVLVLLVVRQLRTSRYTLRAMLMPLVIVAVVGKSYLHGIPTSGNSLALVVLLTGVGLFLGSFSGLATDVWSDGGRYALIKAGAVSAVLWVIGMGGRMAFAIWASTHGGETALAHFSVAHDITGANAWTAALVLMALGEVISRTAVLVLRSHLALDAARGAAVAPVAAARG